MVQLAQFTKSRLTLVPFTEVDDEGTEQKFELKIRHKRITPYVNRELQRIQAELAEEETKRWAKRYPMMAQFAKTFGNGETATPLSLLDQVTEKVRDPEEAEQNDRSLVVEQLIYLVEDPDLMDAENNPLPSSRETYDQVPLAVLTTMLDAIRGTSVPKKSGLKTSSDGTQQEEESDVLRVG